jgi:hypothetical protein
MTMGSRIFSWFASVCLVVLFTLTACSNEPQAKAAPKRIGWKETAKKIQELEYMKKETMAALRQKAQQPPGKQQRL